MCLLINLMVKWSVLNEVFFSLSTVFVKVLCFLTDIFNELTHTHTLTHTPTHTHTHKWTCQTRLKHSHFWLFVTGLFLDIKLQQLRCGLYWCHCFFYVTVITEISLPCWLVFKGVVQLNLLFPPSIHEKETDVLSRGFEYGHIYIYGLAEIAEILFSQVKFPCCEFHDNTYKISILHDVTSEVNFLRAFFCFPADIWRRGFCSATQMNNRKEDMEIASHYRQLLRELNEQRQHGILCDACVIVDGKIFKAHKNVLLGSSRYFKTLYCQVRDCYTWENGSRESVKCLFFSQIIVVLVLCVLPLIKWWNCSILQ